jgi:predicted HicB family RNase H-like nuclease
MMEYKGYMARVEFDDEAEIFHGEVINTKDVITFQGTEVSQLRKAFEESVDDYLEFCEQRGEDPERPFSGNFTVRISPKLHRQISILSGRSGMSLNAYIQKKLSMEVE